MLLPFILICKTDNEKKAGEALGTWAEIRGKVFNWFHKENSNVDPQKTQLLSLKTKLSSWKNSAKITASEPSQQLLQMLHFSEFLPPLQNTTHQFQWKYPGEMCSVWNVLCHTNFKTTYPPTPHQKTLFFCHIYGFSINTSFFFSFCLGHSPLMTMLGVELCASYMLNQDLKNWWNYNGLDSTAKVHNKMLS